MSDIQISYDNNNYLVSEDLPDHHFRTEIPNIVFELGLDCYEFSLYALLKKIAGDRGACWYSMQKLADLLKIGKTKLRDSLEVLKKPQPLLDNRPLIVITQRKNPDKSNDTNVINIVPLWRKNGDHFRKLYPKNPDEGGGSPNGGGGVRQTEGGGSPNEPKEEPSNKNPLIKTSTSSLSPSYEVADSQGKAEVKGQNDSSDLVTVNIHNQHVTTSLSEIFRRFCKTDFSTDEIKHAIAIARSTSSYVDDVFGFLVGIMKTERKKNAPDAPKLKESQTLERCGIMDEEKIREELNKIKGYDNPFKKLLKEDK